MWGTGEGWPITLTTAVIGALAALSKSTTVWQNLGKALGECYIIHIAHFEDANNGIDSWGS